MSVWTLTPSLDSRRSRSRTERWLSPGTLRLLDGVAQGEPGQQQLDPLVLAHGHGRLDARLAHVVVAQHAGHRDLDRAELVSPATARSSPGLGSENRPQSQWTMGLGPRWPMTIPDSPRSTGGPASLEWSSSAVTRCPHTVSTHRTGV